MGRFIDLTGRKFGRLTVIKDSGQKKDKEHLWECKCDCGKTTLVKGVNLREGYTLSCGCLKHENDLKPKGNVIDMTGKKYGKWTVLERAGSDKHKTAMWKCQCECGNISIISGTALRQGLTISCGCERRSHGEYVISQILNKNNIPFIQEAKLFKYELTGYWAKFDFYVDNKYLIEYDGIQHFTDNHGWNNENSVKKNKERDAIKNQWCKDNNIPLIRIPYTHLNDLCIEDLKLETTKFLVN